jgi:hypothetical protein
VDYFEFDAAGRLVEHVQKSFRLGRMLSAACVARLSC